MAYPQESTYSIDCICKNCGAFGVMSKTVIGKHLAADIVYPIYFCNNKCFELYMTCPEISDV